MNGVAITGMGLVSPLGLEPDQYFERLSAGEVIFKKFTLPKDTQARELWVAEVEGFAPNKWLTEKIIDGTDVISQWAISAAEEAIAMSGVTFDPLRTAVIHGTSLCGVQSVMRAQYELDMRGADAVPRKTMMRALTNMPAAQITLRHGLHGPNLSISTACASALDAIGLAAQMIRSGNVDTAIVGATEAGHTLSSGGADGDFAPVMAYAPVAFGMQGHQTEARRACMPFDIERNGVVSSEGSAFFILENTEKALQRKATVYGKVLGYGSLADAFHPSSPDPSGKWEARAMQLALDDADIPASSVDVLFAHGTATPKGDLAEINAINSVHAQRENPLKVTSLKGHFGHPAAASGGMSLIAALLGMREGRFIHTENTTQPDPEADFDIVLKTPVEMNINLAQINAFGFGGQNASLVVEGGS